MSQPSGWLPPFVLVVLAAGPARAGLECPEPVANGGEVRSGVTLRHVFRLVNRGPAAVDVTDVRSSCGCLVPRVDRRHLAPNEEGSLPVEVNTLRQGAGSHNWRIVVRYVEDGKPGELSVILAARVISEVRVEPPALSIHTEAGIAHVLTVTDRRPRPLAVRAVESSMQELRVCVGGAGRDSSGLSGTTVRVEVPADFPEGRHVGVLRILTDDPTYAELEVPVTVVKRPAQQVWASPAEVLLSGPPGTALPAQVVLLSAAQGREVRVDRVEPDDAALECRWAAGPGPRSTLRIRADRARIPSGTLKTAVRVHLRAPSPGTVVVIPVRVDSSQ
jgi:hypothetical protein